MNKNVEYLAFVDSQTGKKKQRFEIILSEKETNETFEGRRCQLIKKLIAHSLKEKWIKFPQLFDHLKKKQLVSTRDLLTYAFSRDD